MAFKIISGACAPGLERRLNGVGRGQHRGIEQQARNSLLEIGRVPNPVLVTASLTAQQCAYAIAIRSSVPGQRSFVVAMSTQNGQLGLIRQDGVVIWSDGVGTTLADSFLYQPATEQVYAWRFGNGLPRMLTFDSDGRLDQISTPGKHDLTFGYDKVDTISSLTDHLYPALSTTFGYDPVDRLASVNRAGSDDQSFQWDKVGNRTVQSREGEGNYNLIIDGAKKLD